MARRIKLTDRGEVRCYDDDNSAYVGLRAPAVVASNLSFTLPGADGTAGQVLQTDGAGNLSFASTAISGGGTSGKIAKFTGSNSIGDSIIEEAGGRIGIGATPVAALLELTEAGDNPVFDILKTGTGGGTVARIENDGTGICLDLDQDANGIALNINRAAIGTLPAVNITNASSGHGVAIVQTGNARGLLVQKTNVGATNASQIQNDGTGDGLFLDQNGNGRGLYVDSEATTAEGARIDSQGTGDGLHIEKQGDGIALDVVGPTTGTAIGVRIAADSSGVGLSLTQTGAGRALDISHSANQPAVRVQKTGTGAGTAVEIVNAGSGFALFLDQNGNGTALQVEGNGTSTSHLCQIVQPSGSSGNAVDIDADGSGRALRVTHVGSGHVARFETTDNSVETLYVSGGSTKIDGFFSLIPESVTIASGAITINKSYVKVDTEAAAATDQLDTINAANAVEGTILYMQAANGARTVTVRDTSVGGGNIRTTAAANRDLDSINDRIGFLYDGTDWIEIPQLSNVA